MKRHLTQDQRCHISILLKRDFSIRAIAKELKVHHSTISREIQRNSGKRGYRKKQAHLKAVNRRSKIAKRKIHPTVWKRVLEMLEEKWSPEQISGRLRKEAVFISHETIYKYVWIDKKTRGILYKNLRHTGKKYNKRSSKKAGRGIIPNRIGIEERPVAVKLKQRFGDLEVDTIVGKNHKKGIVSIVDRSSKYLWLGLLDRITAENTAQEIIKQLQVVSKQSLIHTITSDNGKEFSKHQIIATTTHSNFYFANPYHSWERGLNEHTNGLIRQYFPKKTDFGTITQEEVDIVAFKINNRPRKILNYSSPQEIYDQIGI